MKDYSLKDIENMFRAYHKSVGTEEFIKFVSEKYYELQSQIRRLEETKLSKDDLVNWVRGKQ